MKLERGTKQSAKERRN